MQLAFTKMHGAGNDFVVFDGISQKIDLNAKKIRHIADRHFGVGCDQVLLVESPVNASSDFRYRIFNADGGEVSQCGNGARCFVRFVRDKGLCSKNPVVVDTDAGQLTLYFDSNDRITVDMGVPSFTPQEIPIDAVAESTLYRLDLNGTEWEFGAVSLGNPHAVITVDDIDQAPVKEIGPMLESHTMFPQRANIGFLEIVDIHRIRLRVFERGSGETMACGSGACAAAVIAIEQALVRSPLYVSLPGGDLLVKWEGRGSSVFLTGPAFSVFEGTVEL